jgi:hypothetical protein
MSRFIFDWRFFPLSLSLSFASAFSIRSTFFCFALFREEIGNIIERENFFSAIDFESIHNANSFVRRVCIFVTYSMFVSLSARERAREREREMLSAFDIRKYFAMIWSSICLVILTMALFLCLHRNIETICSFQLLPLLFVHLVTLGLFSPENVKTTSLSSSSSLFSSRSFIILIFGNREPI